MEFNLYLRALLSFFAIISLIGGVALLTRYMQRMQLKKTNKEISILETLFIDSKNKLILIKRKESKYILLLGEKNNLIVDIINES